MKVVLTGDGGDELFLGYEQYSHLNKALKLSNIPGAKIASKAAINTIPLRFFNLFYKHASEMDKEALKRIPLVIGDIKKDKAKAYYDLISIFSEDERQAMMDSNDYEKIDYKTINNNYFKKDIFQSLSYFDTKKLLSESFLMKTDRMTMANSQESRVPLLDYRIATLAHNIPVSIRMSKEPLKKLLLRNFHKDFVYRKKQPFHVPLNRWFLENNSLMEGYDLTKNKHFDKQVVQKIIEKTKKGNLYSTRQFFNLVVFDIWEKRFMR